MSKPAKKPRPADPHWDALVAAEGLCVTPWLDEGESIGWRAVYGGVGAIAIGHANCPLAAATVAMERTVEALREGRSGLVLSAGTKGGQ